MVHTNIVTFSESYIEFDHLNIQRESTQVSLTPHFNLNVKKLGIWIISVICSSTHTLASNVKL